MRERKLGDEYAKNSDQLFLKLYLQYGSVDEVLRSYPEYLPISFAAYHRLIEKYGLVKSAGRHASFPEVLHFFREKMLAPETPLETLYKSMPPSFQTSMQTLHRIYHLIEKRLVRRYATALFISNENPYEIVMAQELTGNSRYGKRPGNLTVPMTFSRKNGSKLGEESVEESILRVLQQEFSIKRTISGDFSPASKIVKGLIPDNIQPFVQFDTVDVRVNVYNIRLTEELISNPKFSSLRLDNHRFLHINDLLSGETENLREGVLEMVYAYEEFIKDGEFRVAPERSISNLNLALTTEAVPSQKSA